MKANETFSVEECCKVSKKSPSCKGVNAFYKLSATESTQSSSFETLPPISHITFPKFKHNHRRHHETRKGDEELEREMELWMLYRNWQNTYKRKGAARDLETVNAGEYNVKIPVSPLPYCSSSSSTSCATSFMDWETKQYDDLQSSGYGTPTYDPECIKRRPNYKRIWKEKDKDKDVDKDKEKDSEKEKDKEKDKDKDKDKVKNKDKKKGRKTSHGAKDHAATEKKDKTIIPKPEWFWTPSVTLLDDIRSTISNPSYNGHAGSSIGSCTSLMSKSDEMNDDKDKRKHIKLWPEQEVDVRDEVPKGKSTDWLKKLEGEDVDDGTLAAFEEPFLYRYPSDVQLATIPYGGAWAIYMKEKENELMEIQVVDEESISEAKIPSTESIKIWRFPALDDIAGEVTIETASAYGECTPRPPHTSPVQTSGVWPLAGDDLAREQRHWEEALARDRIIDDMERRLLEDSEGESSVDTHISDTTAPSHPPDLDKKDKPQTWWEFNHIYRRGHSAFSSSESLQEDVYNIDGSMLVGSDAEENPPHEEASIPVPTPVDEEQRDSIGILFADEATEPLLRIKQHNGPDQVSLTPSKDSWDAYEPEERIRLPSKRIMERPRKATMKKNQQGPVQRSPLRRREFPHDPQLLEKQQQKTSPRQIQKKSPRPSSELPPMRLRGAGSQQANDLEVKKQEKKAAEDSWHNYMPPMDDWIALYKETMRRLHMYAWGRDPDSKRSVKVDESTMLPHASDTIGGVDTRKSSALMHEIKELLSLRDYADEVLRPDRATYIDVFQGEVNVIMRTVSGDILVVDVEIMKQLDLYKAQIESIGVQRFMKQVHRLPPLTLDSIFGVLLWSSHEQAREGDIVDEFSPLSESDDSDDTDTDLFSESVSSSSDVSEDELNDDESGVQSHTSSSSEKKKKKKKKRKSEREYFMISGGEQRNSKKKIARQSAAISKDPELSEDTMALLHAIVSGANTGRLRNILSAADALGSQSLSCAVLRLMGRAMGKDDSVNLKGLVHSLTQGTWLPYYICHTRGCFEDHLRKSTEYKSSYMEEYPSAYGAAREKNALHVTRRSAQMPSPRSSVSSLDSEDNEERHKKFSKRPKASTLSPKHHAVKKSTLRPGKKKHLAAK